MRGGWGDSRAGEGRRRSPPEEVRAVDELHVVGTFRGLAASVSCARTSEGRGEARCGRIGVARGDPGWLGIGDSRWSAGSRAGIARRFGRRHGPRPASSSGAAPTLVYGSARGVAIVGVGPVGSAPSRLYLGTAGLRWRNVTPPGSRRAGTSQLFEQASFLSRSTGWVTAWEPTTDRTTIFRTADGGDPGRRSREASRAPPPARRRSSTWSAPGRPSRSTSSRLHPG